LPPDPDIWLPDNLFLLQEYLPHDAEQGHHPPGVPGGELLYAMRVKDTRPVSTCARRRSAIPTTAMAVCEVPEQPVAAPPVEFYPYPEVPDDAVETATRIVRAARLDVGGIEYLETPDGRRVFYDVNANSNLRPSVAATFGFDPFERVVDFLEAQPPSARVGRLRVGRPAEAGHYVRPGGVGGPACEPAALSVSAPAASASSIQLRTTFQPDRGRRRLRRAARCRCGAGIWIIRKRSPRRSTSHARRERPVRSVDAVPSTAHGKRLHRPILRLG
jgi:hypothetical protein